LLQKAKKLLQKATRSKKLLQRARNPNKLLQRARNPNRLLQRARNPDILPTIAIYSFPDSVAIVRVVFPRCLVLTAVGPTPRMTNGNSFCNLLK
jgi:hypothetical protein